MLGARPLRRTIQREIEDQLSEKILFGEIGAGEIVTVDVENWDGESSGKDAKFVFGTKVKPLPESAETTPSEEAQEAVVGAADKQVPEDESYDNTQESSEGNWSKEQ